MPEHVWSPIAIAALLLALVACELPDLGELESVTSDVMERHFEEATRARDALVAGDLAAASRAARALADEEVPAFLQVPDLEAMRAAAREVVSARDVPSAARAFGGVALACGACHRATGARIETTDAPPPAGTDRRERMRQHQWATDRLWEGLMLPDDGRFAAGAAELVEAPLYPATPESVQTVAPAVRALADRVRQLGRDARQVHDDAGRADAYGEILATCAECHRLVGVRGPAAPVAL